MIKIMSYDDFIKTECRSTKESPKITMSIRMSAQRAEYFKYLSYKTGLSVSKLLEDMAKADFDEVSSADEAGSSLSPIDTK